MSQKSGSPAIIFILLFLLMAAGGYWFFFMKQPPEEKTATPAVSEKTKALPAAPIAGANTASTNFSLPTSVPAGTKVNIDGSTSMVVINKNLKAGFEKQFPGTEVISKAGGSETGIKEVLSGAIDLAAISRPLKPNEKSQGLVEVPVALDAIAIVVGANNPWQGSLTDKQLKDIFEGNIADWSKIGGKPASIKVINRPAISGTHETFKELVLGGDDFGKTANIKTLDRDETTGMLKALGNDGIGYATFAQVAKQKTVRVVPINNTTPDSPSYPYKRTLYYVYKNPASPAVKAFLGYATSPQGQQAMLAGD